MGKLRLPDGKKMACCFCFDIDAMALWLGFFRSPTANPLSRGEFGPRVAVPRILDILDKYNIKATFFTPGHSALLFAEVIQEVHRRGHEIAAHSMYHMPSEVGLEMSGVEPATPEKQRQYLVEQIDVLEKCVGERPVGFRSPIGDWAGEHIPQYLIETGFIYDSSMQGDDYTPYRLQLGGTVQTEEPFAVTWGKPSKLLEIPLHWDTNDFAQFEFLGYYLNPNNPWFSPAPFHTPSQSHEIFSASFDYCYDYVPGGIWNTILHPQCCGRSFKPLWFEKLVQHTYLKPGVWYATMREVAEAWED